MRKAFESLLKKLKNMLVLMSIRSLFEFFQNVIGIIDAEFADEAAPRILRQLLTILLLASLVILVNN